MASRVRARYRPVGAGASRKRCPRSIAAAIAGRRPRRGAYVLSDAPDGVPDLILMASGSEVALIVSAAERLRTQGVAVRCVSRPSCEVFDDRSQGDRDAALPPSVTARLAVEAGVAQGWRRYVGDSGDVLSVDRFGASAPGNEMLRTYGFTVDNVCARARALLGKLTETPS